MEELGEPDFLILQRNQDLEIPLKYKSISFGLTAFPEHTTIDPPWFAGPCL